MTAWWQDLSERERQLIMIGGGVVAAALVLFLVVSPLLSFRNEARADYTSAAETYRRVVLAAAAAGNEGTSDPAAVRSVVTSTANRSGIALDRIASDGGVIDISIGNTQAARLYGWLTALEEQHQIVVRNAQIRSSGTQGISARMTLAPGG